MKRVIIYLLIGCLLVTASSCSVTDSGNGKSDDAKLNVVTTIFPPFDFAREIAGDSVKLTMLLSPGAESHSYDPTPKDIIAVKNCDIFIYGGGESDAWVDKILSSVDSEKITILRMMDFVEVVEEEHVEGMQVEEHDHEEHEEEHNHEEHEEEHDHDHDDNAEDSPEYDEHVWTSPKNAILISKAIGRALMDKDTVNASVYEANMTAYVSKLEELDRAFSEVVQQANRTTVVFGDRFPFRYFVDAYGLTYFAAFPGCAAETESSVQTITFLVDKVNAEQIPVVFYLELSKGLIADTICESTGAKKLQFHSCHNLTAEEFASGKSYLDFMNQNVVNLREALN